MLKLVSHPLCPYVQRAAIVAAEKSIPLERVTIDLANRPDWFLRASPNGKVPLLLVDGAVLFESAVIAEYLDDISEGSLLPADPLRRAGHRAWIEFASATLADIGALYSAVDEASFEAVRLALIARFQRVDRIVAGPWFSGGTFSLVDAAFAPVFRYLDAFETLAALRLADALTRVSSWRCGLRARQSVRQAVAPEFPALLADFLARRNSYLSGLIGRTARAA
ncbi:glutathione S-transferase family protein [Sphingomonas parva]|uniref:Glutathione S-transferase family protein n=1 Tax=Sphingomonas parva TaxID=2555898 RepID=A0A4Y8ZV00_9SPHN|nr:glutathione S-transferase family protein [Sphingomonas parva]TFI59851.1 glutathione S-transferase family protein [Sphingomonas parva]